MIMPTVGRIVWYHRHVDAGRDPNGQPLAAILAKVIDERIINLTVCNADGTTFPALHVPLLQEGDQLEDPNAAYAEWTPYQKGQAAKTEQLQATAPAQINSIYAALDQLATGTQAKLDQFGTSNQAKFEDLGAWLQKTVGDLQNRLAALEKANAAPPAPANVPPIGQNTAQQPVGT
jgi:hypothetical protein